MRESGRGKEGERECVTGCSERGSEVAGEIGREKIGRGNVRA